MRVTARPLPLAPRSGCRPRTPLTNEQKLLNTFWILAPALLAVMISASGGKVQVVARALPAAPVSLPTDQPPASVDGFFWETRSTPGEHRFQMQDGRSLRLRVQPGETLLWCREVRGSVYSLAGHGADRIGPPCVIDPPFVLRRQPVSGGPARVLRADLPSPSVFVMPSGAVCYADVAGIHRLRPTGDSAELLCPLEARNVTAWGAAGRTLYWIEEAAPGASDPVGSCRLLSLAPGARRPRLIAWAPDALTNLVVSEGRVVWYHPAGRTLEGVGPAGAVTVFARDVNLAETPTLVGDRLFYLRECRGGGRELATVSVSSGGGESLAHLDASARILGVARDGLYLSDEERGGLWPASGACTGRLLRVPFAGS